MKNVIYLAFNLLFLLLGCKDNSLSPVQMSDFLEEPKNGFISSVEDDSLKYVIKIMPPEFRALTGLDPEKEYNEYSDEFKKHVGHLYLSMQVYSKLDSASVVQLLNHKFNRAQKDYDPLTILSFYQQEHIQIQVGQKKYPLKIYHMEPVLSESRGARFTMVFEGIDLREILPDEDFIFIWNGTHHSLNVPFQTALLSKLPELKI